MKWAVTALIAAFSLASVASASATLGASVSPDQDQPCRVLSENGQIPTYREWQSALHLPVPVGALTTDDEAFDARLASGEVQAFAYIPLCESSQAAVWQRLRDLGYSAGEIAEMNPIRQELAAVKGVPAEAARKPFTPSLVTSSQLYHGVVLTPNYNGCPADAECRRIESVWWWRTAPWYRFTDRLAWSWSREWVFEEYTAYNRLSEWGCFNGNCRGFYFIDNTIWDSVLDNGTSVRIDIHNTVWYQGQPYSIQQWQGEAGIDIVRDRSCSGSSCRWVTMTVLQRYYHQVVAAGFTVSFGKEPSLSVTPGWAVESSYDRTANWRYRDQ